MKCSVIMFAIAIIYSITASGQIKIGGSGAPDAAAVLELDGGVSRGLLLPRLSSTQMGSMTTAPDGLILYNNSDGFMYVRKSGAWQKIADATNNGAFSLPYSGTASTVGGAEFSITHGATFGDAAYFTSGGGNALTTGNGNNKFNITGGNTGIGIPAGLSESPTLGRLVVRGVVGNTSAVFGDKTTGIALENTPPAIAFNSYLNSGSKTISDGFGARISHNTSTGLLSFSTTSSSGTAGNSNDAAMLPRMVVSSAGNVGIGTVTPTLGKLHIAGTNIPAAYFTTNLAASGNVINAEYTGPQADVVAVYGRSKPADYYGIGGSFEGGYKGINASVNSSGGNSYYGGYFTVDGGTGNNYGVYSSVSGGSQTAAAGYFNSVSGNAIVTGSGNVGIGLSTPQSPLSFAPELGKKISLYRGTTGDAGFGVFGNELRINSDHNAADITFGYDNLTNGFTERVRMKADGTVGIGTNAPVSKLDVKASLGDGITVSPTNAGYSPVVLRPGGGGGIVGTTSNASMNIMANNSVNITLTAAGNVGIATPSPTNRLDVNGRLRLRKEGIYGSGVWIDGPTVANNTFFGMEDDNNFGFFSNTTGWMHHFNVADGTVRIGTNQKATGYMLNVGGKIISEEVRVQLRASWPDYVFAKNYSLKPLAEVEKYISENNHLPNMPSAAEVEKDGQMLGEIQRKMMEKIEELTLYVIDLKKENDALKNRITAVEKK